jgi:hypothetical protein
MTYDEWEAGASDDLRRDPSWKVEAYRLAAYGAAAAWEECRAWYTTVAAAVRADVLETRLANLLSITRLLLTMIRREREKRADWMDHPRIP